MTIVNAAISTKTVADPNAEYESIRALWRKSRAVCSGERYVKAYDSFLDRSNFTNLLIPFSPSMSQLQYEFYKAEAELPGIVSQFSKTLLSGLLRKQPILKLPEKLPKNIYNWIMNEFNQDDSSLASFLDICIWEELQTSRAWVYVDHPVVDPDTVSIEDKDRLKPYPVLWKAEDVINWQTSKDTYGKSILSKVIVRTYEESFEANEFHPAYRDTVTVHELDKEGFYQIRVFQQTNDANSVQIVNGQQIKDYSTKKPVFQLLKQITNILNNGERLKMIPAWPLNGNINLNEPALMPFIDKEVALYNKLSRRNHLLYGASTYTPIISSDMSDDEFDRIVDSGLGSWIRLRQGDTASVLQTPTEALTDMDRAIAATIEEMAKMGIRMLSPETAQSGIALEIRNAAQTAQLGFLNTKISNTFRQIIAFMINWRYNLLLKPEEIEFSLSADFNPTPVGADWLRLATEWYQQGLIPRSVWITMLKQNDLVSPDYNDEEGKLEITADMDAVMKAQGSSDYANQISALE